MFQIQLYLNISHTEINVLVPSFNGQSYLRHSLPEDFNSNFSIDLTLLTSQSNGLLLFSSGRESDFFSLNLVNGFPRLRLSINSQLTVLTSTIRVDDDVWHTVSVSRVENNLYLAIDGIISDNTTTSNSQGTLFEYLYVGGVPFFFEAIQEGSQGLIGCIRDFQISRIRVDIVNNALSGVSISQCSEPVCSYVICQNGATCFDIQTLPGFMCSCEVGYTGEFCETLIPLCIPNPCNGGMCSQEGDTFSCLCPLLTGGRICDQGIDIHCINRIFWGVKFQ